MKNTQRIVSLVPSLTELLFALNLDEEVVGITKFCIHPTDKVKGRPIVGGTKTIHLDRVAALAPTLILANKEENTREDIEALQTYLPVLLTDVVTLADAIDMIRTVGTAVHRFDQANRLAATIDQSFAALRSKSAAPTCRVAYLIWRDPWMVAGSQTFIDAMLQQAGFSNAFANQPRYPIVSDEVLREANPDVIMLSSEPYPFAQKHLTELTAICPQAQVLLVDGELFSWYGTRLLDSAAYFRSLQQIINPF